MLVDWQVAQHITILQQLLKQVSPWNTAGILASAAVLATKHQTSMLERDKNGTRLEQREQSDAIFFLLQFLPGH